MAKKISAKQQKFIQAYCRERNASKAARLAGYSEKTAGQRAWQLLNEERYAHIQAEIKKILDDRETQDAYEHELLRQWHISRLKLDTRALIGQDGQPKPLNELTEEQARHVQSFQISEFGTEGAQNGKSFSYKLNSGHEAAKQLAASNGFTDRTIKLDVNATYQQAEDQLLGLLGSLIAGEETKAFLEDDDDSEADS